MILFGGETGGSALAFECSGVANVPTFWGPTVKASVMFRCAKTVTPTVIPPRVRDAGSIRVMSMWRRDNGFCHIDIRGNLARLLLANFKSALVSAVTRNLFARVK